ncbi:HK97-gp10 family putative phage morphogenesis protein [Lentilitoribacter sp. EG35]|uniref:HK97-gp10 family putative phage morphogenesis protein n=1 Tax=Lentilitoribacter sp. EG35 TaxID=3234192 RepID=UPI0034610E2D
MSVEKIEGLRDLEKAFAGIDKAVTRDSVARRVLKKNGQPLADKMNDLAPVGAGENGNLNKSYAVSTKLNKRQRKFAKKGKSDVEVYVGTSDPAGLQQEFGNKNHDAQPHVRPAWDGGKNEALDGIVKDTGIELIAAVKRQAKRKLKALK